MSVHFHLLFIAIELVVLTLSAERFIYGATALAQRWQWPDFISGVLLLALGTSLPEFMVSVVAVGHQHALLAVGGAVGSNISNVLLVLGLVACLRPLSVRGLVRRQVLVQTLVLLAVTLLLVLWLIITGMLMWPLGVLLWVGCIGYMYLLWRQMQQDKAVTIAAVVHTQLVDEKKVEQIHMPVWRAAAYWLLGLVGLLLSSHYLVNSVLAVGHATGISESVLGLTVVALGTSLPELAASVVSAWQGKHAMVLGNVIGSNCFNLLAVAAVPATFSHAVLSHSLRWRDLPCLAVVTLLVVGLLWWRRRPIASAQAVHSGGQLSPGIYIGRALGVAMVLLYLVYIALLILGVAN